MTREDDFIHRTEQSYLPGGRHISYGVTFEPFCVQALVRANPSDPHHAYGKKMIINKLRSGIKGPIDCRVPGCEVKLDNETLETTEGACKLAAICLKQTWDNREGTPDEQRAFDEIAEIASDGPGSHECPNPFCDFHAGWSEDGVAGTTGTCIHEESPSDPAEA